MKKEVTLCDVLYLTTVCHSCTCHVMVPGKIRKERKKERREKLHENLEMDGPVPNVKHRFPRTMRTEIHGDSLPTLKGIFIVVSFHKSPRELGVISSK